MEFNLNVDLPNIGMLYFFASVHKDGFPTDGCSTDDWVVIYSDKPSSSLVRRLPDHLPEFSEYRRLIDETTCLPPSLVLCEAEVSFEQGWTLPVVPRDDYRSVESYNSKYYDILRGRDGEPSHSIGGHPQAVQGEMNHLCVGACPPDYPLTLNARDKVAIERKEIERWHHLLQIDSDPRIGLEWAALGRAYFWINDRGLKVRNFCKSVLINQHT